MKKYCSCLFFIVFLVASPALAQYRPVGNPQLPLNSGNTQAPYNAINTPAQHNPAPRFLANNPQIPGQNSTPSHNHPYKTASTYNAQPQPPYSTQQNTLNAISTPYASAYQPQHNQIITSTQYTPTAATDIEYYNPQMPAEQTPYNPYNPPAPPTTTLPENTIPAPAIPTSPAYRPSQPSELTFSGNYGYRTSNISLTRASSGDTQGTVIPNPQEENAFKEIITHEFGLGAEYKRPLWELGRLHLESNAYYGEISDGELREASYASNGFTNATTINTSTGTEGHTAGFSAAMGYAVNLLDDPFYSRATTNLTITPLFGFALRDLSMTHTSGTNAAGTVNNFRNSLDSRWYGAFIGTDIETTFNNIHTLGFRSEYHFARYNGYTFSGTTGNAENIVTSGKGIVFGLDYTFNINPRLGLSLGGSYEHWKTDPGISYSSRTGAETRINKVDWESQKYIIGASYSLN